MNEGSERERSPERPLCEAVEMNLGFGGDSKMLAMPEPWDYLPGRAICREWNQPKRKTCMLQAAKLKRQSHLRLWKLNYRI